MRIRKSTFQGLTHWKSRMRMRMRRQQKQVSRWLTHTIKHTHTLARTTTALENFWKARPAKCNAKKQQHWLFTEKHSQYTHTHMEITCNCIWRSCPLSGSLTNEAFSCMCGCFGKMLLTLFSSSDTALLFSPTLFRLWLSCLHCLLWFHSNCLTQKCKYRLFMRFVFVFVATPAADFTFHCAKLLTKKI